MKKVAAKIQLLHGLILLLFMVVAGQAWAYQLPELLAMDGQKIVNATLLNVREAPDPAAPVLGQVSLGEVLKATQRTKEMQQQGDLSGYWYLVSAGDLNGWASGVYLRDYKQEEKSRLWFHLIKERLDNPELSFSDAVALHQFVSKVLQQPEDPQWQAAFALADLLSLQKSFDLVNFDNEHTEPYQSWVNEHQAAERVFHDEISGSWLVPVDDYWELAEQFRDQRGGDEVAWYAASARLGGECEGDVSCILQRELMTYGEYLKQRPYGNHAAEALKRIADSLDYVLSALAQQPNYFAHVDTDMGVFDQLYDAVASSNMKLSEHAEAYSKLKAIRQYMQ